MTDKNNDNTTEECDKFVIPHKIPRRISKQIMIGDIPVGGGAPISVQTMTKTKTADVEATVNQIARCKDKGVDIVRMTINDKYASAAVAEIVKRSAVPLVADIHFNHIFAIQAIEAGIAKVRINPGNIGSKDRIQQVLAKAKERNTPIRIGINSGSLERDILEKYGTPTAEALFESAMRHVNIARDFGFENMAVSVKSTSVPLTIEAYRLIAAETDLPLHLGVTEAGTIKGGTIKSAVGIGTLLAEGIGDTIRVSLTDEPETEVELGRDILRSLHLAQRGLEIISCPTCGRLDVDMFSIMNQLEEKLKDVTKNVSVAVLGCAVNGPGEAKDADIGVACAKGEGTLFRKGKKIRVIKEADIINEVYREVMEFEPGK